MGRTLADLAPCPSPQSDMDNSVTVPVRLTPLASGPASRPTTPLTRMAMRPRLPGALIFPAVRPQMRRPAWYGRLRPAAYDGVVVCGPFSDMAVLRQLPGPPRTDIPSKVSPCEPPLLPSRLAARPGVTSPTRG